MTAGIMACRRYRKERHMKIYKKSECEIINGQIVKDNEIIGIPEVVYNLFDVLEEYAQKAKYLNDQPKAQKVPSLDGFVRKSSYELPLVEMPKTPASDKQVKQAMAIMQENDEIERTRNINNMIKEFEPLLQWVASDHVCDSGIQNPKIDLPTIGNILEVKEKDIVDICKMVCDAYSMEVSI